MFHVASVPDRSAGCDDIVIRTTVAVNEGRPRHFRVIWFGAMDCLDIEEYGISGLALNGQSVFPRPFVFVQTQM